MPTDKLQNIEGLSDPRIEYRAYYNAQTHNVILTGTGLPQPVGSTSDASIFYTDARNADGSFVNKTPVAAAQTELVAQYLITKEYPDATITFFGQGQVGLAVSIASYDLRANEQTRSRVEGTLTYNSWTGPWTTNKQPDEDVLDLRPGSKLFNDDIFWPNNWSLGGTQANLDTSTWADGSRLLVKPVVGKLYDAFSDGVSWVVSTLTKNPTAVSIADKVLEVSKDSVVDFVTGPATAWVDATSATSSLAWLPDNLPVSIAAKVLSGKMSIGQWNVQQGRSANGYALNTTNFAATGPKYDTSVGTSEQAGTQITTFKDPATGAIMEAHVLGKMVNGQFEAAPDQVYVSGVTTDGKVVIPGLTDSRTDYANAIGSGQGVINPPPMIPSTPRNSSQFVTQADTHSVIVGAGGTLSDVWVSQKDSVNGFKNEDDFYVAVLQANSDIRNKNIVSAGQRLYLPQKMNDGSITYNFANGASINQSASSGEYYMVVPRTDGVGGQLVYSRTQVDVTADGTPIYEIKQIGTTGHGVQDISYTGRQIGQSGDIEIQGLTERIDTNNDGSIDLNLTRDRQTDTKFVTGIFGADGENLLNGKPLFGSSTSATNPTIFDLSTDPTNLKPAESEALGRSTGGQGLLGSGAGYQFGMASDFVNKNGLGFTGSSAMATGQIRAGNLNKSDVSAQLNAARQEWFNEAHADPQVLPQGTGNTSSATPAPQGLVMPSGSALSTLNTIDEKGNVVSQYTGNYVKNSNGLVTGFYTADGQYYIQLKGGVTGPNGRTQWSGWNTVKLKDAATSLNQQDSAQDIAYTDPLALDSGNDGILFGAAPVNFDLNADGVSEKLTWTAPTDPVLVLDVDGNGRIDNGSELLDLSDSGKPSNLASLDTSAQGGNNDKKLTNADGAFAKLRIWTDRNQDGYASQQEMQSLTDAGIVSIDLDLSHRKTDVKGNLGVEATYADNSKRTLWDVPFGSTSGDVVASSTHYSDGIDKISASGQTALRALTDAGSSITLQGSGATQAIGGYGNDTLIGTMADDWLIGGQGADKFQGGAGKDLLIIDAEDRMADIDGGSDIDTVLVADDRGVLLNLAQINTEVVYGGYGNDVFIGGGADNYFIDGAAGDDLIIGGIADDVLSGADGKDVIQGGKGDDLIRGGRDADQLYGGDGNDVLDGGQGDDTVNGEAGNDVIIASGGRDTVDGGDGTDLIELQGQLEDYKFEKAGANSWRITDTRNVDGSLVVTGQVSDRDGIQEISNVERFSFKCGGLTTVMDLGQASPLPINDRVSDLVIGRSMLGINASSLLANDLDFQNTGTPQLSITWVGDAVGGSVALTDDRIVFMPTIGYTGPLEFSYTIQDRESAPHAAPIVNLINDPSQQGIMKARVVLVPAGSDAPTDPGYSAQWYLGAVDAPAVWKSGYTGKGVNVLVLDPPGTYSVGPEVADLNNPDLMPNRAATFQDTTAHSKHATLVAGVIAAARNGEGSVGVAYDAKLDSISLPSGSIATLGSTLARMRDYDVVNNSWGYDEAWNTVGASPQYAQQKEALADAIEEAATSGRRGLGTVMVFAAGNDRDKGYDSGLSILTANSQTINVGAINRVTDIGTGDAVSRPFSQRGANILVSAPGSSILTTSTVLRTSDGNATGSPTEESQGTSLAAPIVSGVVALMLQANPKLTYRDVQTILALTAKKEFGAGAVNGTSWIYNHTDDWNGSGLHFNADFGFGMVDADAAVRMSESWVTEQNHFASTYTLANAIGEALPDQGTRTLTFTVDEKIGIEQVILDLKLDHERWSDLVVTLKSPQGTTSTLLDRNGYQAGKVFASNPAGELHFDQALMSTHFRGENAKGIWTLTIQDAAAGGQGSGSIVAGLNLVGTDASDWKRYTLTDEYTGNWSLAPTTTQQSELNASAMSSGVKLDASGGSSIVNGKALSIGTGLDRLVGGLGNDKLIGAMGNETLIGGAGDDSLVGGAGADELQGGAGNDVIDGGAGTDLLVSGLGNDSLTGGADADIFLIDGNVASTTTIRDFNTAQDTLRIKTKAPLAWSAMQQVVENGKLTITAGQARVILEGMTTQLTPRQLIGMADGDALLLTASGQYAQGNDISVQPIGEALFVPESRSWLTDTTNPSQFAGETLTYLGSGVYRVEHVTPQRYDLVNLHWASGTDGADNLIAGEPIPRAPEHISQETWTQAVLRMGAPVYSGYGGDDQLTGSERDEYLAGGADNDTLTGSKGNDCLDGGSGADQFVFNVGDGQDTITSSASPALDASDTLVFHTSSNTFSAVTGFQSSSKDAFTATTRLNYGGATDSVKFASTFTADQLTIGGGIALFNAQFDSGTPVIAKLDGKTTTNDADVIEQSMYGSKAINALAGDDLIFALKNNTLNIDGGSGDDTIYALEGSNTLQGNDGNDRIEVTASAPLVNRDTLIGGKGNDTLKAGNSGATMYGDYSDATAADSTSNYNDTLEGGAGADIMYGGYGKDLLKGGLGADKLSGDSGDDILNGDQGNDTLWGGDDNDVLSGGDDNDELHGGLGEDNLVGGLGADLLYGDDGNDVLIGGDGDDVLDGGIGNDYFDSGSGNDTINVNLSSGNDTVDSATGVDVVRINGISSTNTLGLTLLENSGSAKLTWGTNNSLTYTQYNLDTQIWLDGDVKTTLRNVFNEKKLYPDETFRYLSQYDLQLSGDPKVAGTLIGDADADQLYGGPKGTAVENPADNGIRYGSNDAAYWYVVAGAGNDTLSGGKSGAILDGGGGDDSIRISNGTLVVRDTFHGGTDTLYMPEGMTPETLRFFRIANPLQAKSSYADLFGVSSPTSIEQLIPGSTTLGSLMTLPEGNSWNSTRYLPGFSNFPHYDTLRIQSLDGKYTIDIAGYFDSDSWKNNISNMVFPTVFDEKGNSKAYSISDFTNKIQDGRYSLTPTTGKSSGYITIENPYDGSSLYDYPISQGKAIIGGESGTKLYGSYKVLQTSPDWETIYSSATIGYLDYQKYKSAALARDGDFLWTEDSNGHVTGSGAAIMPGLKDNPYLPGIQSFTVNAIAAPDYILGFEGNDTIVAGGTYVEQHTSTSQQFTRNPHTDASSLGDIVNGGGGDDTYIFHKGDGNLHIIALDEENAGAEGLDTLDLSDYQSSDVKWGPSFYEDGAGDISLSDGSEISIDTGRNGLLQVDTIIFSDTTIDVRSLINSDYVYTSAEGRPYRNTLVDYATARTQKSVDDRYWSLLGAVPASSLMTGTPKSDVIRVQNNSVAAGNEGMDDYLIDMNATDFAVVMMDKGDSVDFMTSVNLADYRKKTLAASQFVGGNTVDATYLNKTEAQWIDAGMLPLSNPSFAQTGVAHLRSTSKVTLQYGKLASKGGVPASTMLSLSDWQPLDGSFDDVSDALITWQTTVNAEVKNHYVVLAGVLDSTGHSVTRSTLNIAKTSRLLGQGNDYDAGGGVVYGLAGDDTVDAYANDSFQDGEYIGSNDDIYGGSGNDSLDGGAGRDSLFGGVDNDTLIGGLGEDYLDGGVGADRLIGGVGNDIYIVDGNDTVIEGVDKEDLHRGIWSSSNINGPSPNLAQYAKLDSGILFVAPSKLQFAIDQFGAIETISALDDPATAASFEAKQAHIAGKIYTHYWMTEVYRSEANPYNNPAWELVAATPSEYRYKSIAIQAEELHFYFADCGTADEIRGDVDIDLRDTRYANVENVTALGNTSHYLTGNSGANMLSSNGAGCTLEGLGGDDIYTVFSNLDQIVETDDGGHDAVYTLADIDRLANNVEDIYSKGHGLTLHGNAMTNHIVGDDQDNLIDGDAGADLLEGGMGNDSYVVSSLEDVIIEKVSGGSKDTVWVMDKYVLGDIQSYDIEYMRAYSTNGVSMQGNSLSKQVLVGGVGEDTLNGGGGTGDSLYGGLGNDVYVINSTSDVIVEDAGGGTDTAQIAYNNAGTTATVLSAGLGGLQGIENIEMLGTGLFSLSGDANANRLVGNAYSNTLTGGAGKDTLIGGEGDDTYVVGMKVGDNVASPDIDIVQDRGSSTNDTLVLGIAGASTSGDGLNDYSNNLKLTRRLGTQGDSLQLDSYSIWAADQDNTTNYEGVLLAQYFEGAAYKVENIQFADSLTQKTANLISQKGYDFYGTNGDDVMDGSVDTGSRTLFAGSGNDRMIGSIGSNTLYGDAGNDTLDGDKGPDTLYGGSGSDTFVFGVGYGIDEVYDIPSDISTISLEGVNSKDTSVIFERVATTTYSSLDPAYTNDQDLIVRFSGNASDKLRFMNWWSGSASDDGNRFVRFNDGTVLNLTQIEARVSATKFTTGDDTCYSGSNADSLAGLTGNDEIHGGKGNDTLHGNDGADRLYGDEGDDQLFGDAGSDVLDGGAGADRLDGGAGFNTFYVDNAGDTVLGGGQIFSIADFYSLGEGTTATLYLQEGANRNAAGNSQNNTLNGNAQSNLLQGAGGADYLLTGNGGLDVLQGGEGDDFLSGYASPDNGVYDGGDGNDQLFGNRGNNLFVGGKGNDRIYAGTYETGYVDENGESVPERYGATGNDIVLFNKGDGMDTLYAGDGAKLTLSLGGGIDYSVLTLSQSGNDLILGTGISEGITLHDWYGSDSHKSVLNVQLIAEAMAGFNANGTDQLRNHKFEQFAFDGIVNAFDAQDKKSSWHVPEEYLPHLAGGSPSSNTAAFGGDLAYQYGMFGTMTGLSLSGTQSLISQREFGTGTQTINTVGGSGITLGL
ncbi:hypothetical protein JY96_05760 [Aquabacterium sp. NJ1]|nr:hypothetical protein JY96_05760 [Aquabacterium sp. NJ1]